jgi:hypothetical protein
MAAGAPDVALSEGQCVPRVRIVREASVRARPTSEMWKTALLPAAQHVLNLTAVLAALCLSASRASTELVDDFVEGADALEYRGTTDRGRLDKPVEQQTRLRLQPAPLVVARNRIDLVLRAVQQDHAVR